MKNIFATAWLVVGILIPGFAQKKITLPEFNLQKPELEAHMRFLASDELMGRRTGEPGNLAATRYVAEQFRRYGLANAPNQTSFMQTVPLEKMGALGKGELVVGTETLRSGQDWILMSGGASDIAAPLVYAGFGLENAEKGWEGYKGLDVVADLAPEQGLFDHSDNVSFAKLGIPAPPSRRDSGRSTRN